MSDPSAVQAARVLAICRIAIFGLLAIDVASMRDPALFAELPREWFAPHGPLRWLPAAAQAALFDPSFLRALRWIALMLAGAAAAGLRGYAVFATAFCVAYGLLRAIAAGFSGFVGHGWLAMTVCSWVLAAFPAADAFALRRSPRATRRIELYAAPLVAMGALLCTCYFALGVRRFARGGLEIFLGDALPTTIGLASLKDGAVPGGFEQGLVILTSPLAAVAMKAGYFAVTLMEVAAPLCVLWPPFRWPWLAVMIPFHVSTLFTMNVFFENNLVLMLLLLTPLPGWIAAKPLRGR